MCTVGSASHRVQQGCCMASTAPASIDDGAQPQQLAQARVPLEQASAAFETPDALGRTPIVVLPQRNLRIRIDAVALAAALLVGALLALTLDWSTWLVGLLFVGAGVL